MRDQATRLREIAERYCERPATRPYTITVTSGKGGVGKSTIALNLAVRFAQLGNATMLLDADDNLGTLDVMAGVSPTRRLGDVLRGDADVDDALVSPMRDLFILAGNSGDSNVPRLNVTNQRTLLDTLSDLDAPCEYLIIDTAAGIGDDVVGFAVRSHETIVVTIPEPTAVMDAYAMIKMMTRADAAAPIRIIVNAAHSPAEADDTAAKLQLAVKTFLHRHVPYLGWIARDANVSHAIRRQSPVVKEFPLTKASLALQLIAERLLMQTSAARVRRFQAA
jgi:flagellar biosynthesis protein FlhG